MVKIKKATNIVPSKAAPLEKVIKSKKLQLKQNVAKKLATDEQIEKPHIPLVVKPKLEKKTKAAKKVKQLESIVEQIKPKEIKNLQKVAETKKQTKTKKNKKQQVAATAEIAAQKNVAIKQTKLAKKSAVKPLVSVQIKNTGKVQKPKAKKTAKQQAAAVKSKLGKKSKSKGKPELANVPIKLTVAADSLPAFNEEEFKSVLNLQNITKISQALKALVEQQVAGKKNALFSDYRYYLNVGCFKIPDCPKRMVKLSLKHSLINKAEDDVLIVVPDLKRGAKTDYEPTIEHYTNLFRENGVDDLGYRLKIMPFNQLRQEHKSFEAVRKLAATYDYYLCEGRIVGHAVGCVGKIFQKPRTTFHAVHLDKLDRLKERIEKALRRTAYKQLHKGDLISIPIGHQELSAQELAENVEFVVEQLKELYAGGWPNIRNMHLKIDITGTSALPLFVSNCQPPEKTPNVLGLKEKRLLKLKREANAVLERFQINKRGELKKLTNPEIKRKKIAQEHQKKLRETAKETIIKDDGVEEDDAQSADNVDVKNAVKDDTKSAKKSKVVLTEVAATKAKPAKKSKLTIKEIVDDDAKPAKKAKVAMKQNEEDDAKPAKKAKVAITEVKTKKSKKDKQESAKKAE